VPADGFADFAGQIWVWPRSLMQKREIGCRNQHLSPNFPWKAPQKIIMENKDLDLPTQRQLLAQYRCAEIAKVCRPSVL